VDALIIGIIMLCIGGFVRHKKATSDWNYFYRLAASVSTFVLIGGGALILFAGLIITFS